MEIVALALGWLVVLLAAAFIIPVVGALMLVLLDPTA